MRDQPRTTKTGETRKDHSMHMPLIGGLCMIGLIIALYFTFISGEPGFREFSSMSVFP